MVTKKKTKNITSLEKELEEIKKKIPEMEKVVNENAFHELLKIWGKTVLVTLIIGTLSAIVGYWIALQYPVNQPNSIISSVRIESSIGSILGPSVTAIGLVLGFSPVISFFFINSLKDEQKYFDEFKKNQVEELSKDKKLATEENKSLIETKFEYLNIIINNRSAGVLKYVSVFVMFCGLMLPLLIEFYLIFSPIIFVIFDILLIFLVVEGIYPIITICNYKPTFRIKEVFVGTNVPNQIAIRKELEIA